MKPFKTGFPPHINRLMIVIFSLVTLVAFVRIVVIPPALKDRKIHRANTVEREMAKKVKYAGSGICVDCHEDIYDAKNASFHQNISCETCHGPSADHADDDEIKPEVVTESDFCLNCHRYDSSRPTGFAQVDPGAHNPTDACIDCHDAHDPTPTETPKDCNACHGSIAQTKANSPHARLKCTDCHVGADAHKDAPHTVKPKKPDKRDSCGKCHSDKVETTGLEAESNKAKSPKIDLATHGEKYLCWQCHYPHMPEIKNKEAH